MLKHTHYRDIKMPTPYGVVPIDNKGVVEGLSEKEEARIASVVTHFVYKENKKAESTPKANSKPKEKPKAESTPKEKAKSKTATKEKK